MPFLPTEARQLLDLQVGAVEPTLRVNGDALVADVDRWLDTSVTPALWRLWDGADWQQIGPTLGSMSLDDLSDVDLSAGPVADATVALVEDPDTPGLWVPGTVTSGGGGGSAGYTEILGDGVEDTFTVTHGLSTKAILVQAFELTSGEQLIHGTDYTTTILNASSIEVVFTTAPATNDVRVNVVVAVAGAGAVPLAVFVDAIGATPALNATSMVLDVSAVDIQAGDMLVVAACTRNKRLDSGSPQGPQGGGAWTLRHGVSVTNAGGASADPWTSRDEQVGIWSRVATVDDESVTQYTIAMVDTGTDGARGVLLVFRGPTTWSESSLAGGTLNAPARNGAEGGVVVGIWSSALESTSDDFTGPPSGWTEGRREGTNIGTANGTRLYAAYKILTSDTGTGLAAVQQTGMTDYLAAASVLLAP